MQCAQHGRGQKTVVTACRLGGGWSAEAGILVTNGREQRCPWSPGDSEVNGGSIGMRMVS